MKSSGQNGNCLHLVVRSSFEALDNCLSQIEPGDSVLFLDDGVMHAVADGKDSSESRLPERYFSSADVQARGLQKMLNDSDSVLSDLEIASLIMAHDYCLTWK